MDYIEVASMIWEELYKDLRGRQGFEYFEHEIVEEVRSEMRATQISNIAKILEWYDTH